MVNNCFDVGVSTGSMIAAQVTHGGKTICLAFSDMVQRRSVMAEYLHDTLTPKKPYFTEQYFGHHAARPVSMEESGNDCCFTT